MMLVLMKKFNEYNYRPTLLIRTNVIDPLRLVCNALMLKHIREAIEDFNHKDTNVCAVRNLPLRIWE